MNKFELSNLKKNFKFDNERRLEVLEVVNSYCKKDKSGMKTIFSECVDFSFIDEDLKESHFDNFKKLFTGALGTKLFELDFELSASGSLSKKTMYKLLNDGEFDSNVEELVNNICSNTNYETDILITTILGEVFLPSKGKSDDEYKYKVVLCSINKLEECEKEVTIDSHNNNLILKSADIVVNMKKPLDGFMFPSISDFKSDVNKILYSSGKANGINEKLTREVLHCDKKLTAKQEKKIFDTIFRETSDNKMSLTTMSCVMNKISEAKINNEDGLISAKNLGKILEDNGVENAKGVLTGIVTDMDTMIKIDNIIPSGKKGIKLNNSDVTVSFGTNFIDKISHTHKDGKKCLLIELAEDVRLDDIKVI